uniref:Uncharacterized protein n=1 Tax=Anguilla anguilla TaxID=7936 RepID=A0A0E9R0G7_ANGAN
MRSYRCLVCGTILRVLNFYWELNLIYFFNKCFIYLLPVLLPLFYTRATQWWGLA